MSVLLLIALIGEHYSAMPPTMGFFTTELHLFTQTAHDTGADRSPQGGERTRMFSPYKKADRRKSPRLR